MRRLLPAGEHTRLATLRPLPLAGGDTELATIASAENANLGGGRYSPDGDRLDGMTAPETAGHPPD